MKRTIITLIILAVGFIWTSCDEEKGQTILEITAISPASEPFGDVITSEGTIPDDEVEITVANELKNASGLSSLTYADVILDAVTFTYNRVDGGSDAPAPFRFAVTYRVGANGDLTFTAPILKSTTKIEFPISDLINFGYERSTNFVKIKFDVTVEITGKTIEGDPMYARGAITMIVANWAD
jgi:hypothetical protein